MHALRALAIREPRVKYFGKQHYYEPIIFGGHNGREEDTT
jgi:hypothetical protein